MLKPAIYWCPNKASAINLLIILKSQGVIWSNYDNIEPFAKNNWDEYIDQTCYRLSSDNKLSFADLEFYKARLDYYHLDLIIYDKTSINYYLNTRGEHK